MNYQQQFNAIDQVLTETRQYWQILPFQHLTLPWPDNLALSSFLNSLSFDQLASLDSDDQLLRTTFTPFFDFNIDCIDELALVSPKIIPCPDRLKAAIKGRKWQQIERFEALVPQGADDVLEWCAGKGHLGRLVAFHQQRTVTSVEWQESLCQQGQLLSDKFKLTQQFVQSDVFSITVSLLQQQQQAVALHACGDLHTALLQQAVVAKTRDLLIAPCCYHLIRSDHYQSLSAAAGDSELRLSKRDLNLSMQKTVVAGARIKKFRTIEITWRLGFDLLQRDIRGVDEYMPLPAIKQSMLMGNFEQFCAWASALKAIVISPSIDLSHYEQAGSQRRLINARIEIVTHAFRQLLERWLLLDRVLLLDENGYDVELFNFCEDHITPRNAVIKASY